MTDFILQFPDEETAIELLPQFYDASWNESICIPDISVYKIDSGITQQPDGWFIRIAGENNTGLPTFDQADWICEPVFA